MKKANVFKKFLILILTGMVAVGNVMLGDMTALATGMHTSMPLMADGRPKFMIEKIDIFRNKLIYAYVDDGEMSVKPSRVGVAWFRMNRYANSTDVTNLENFEFFTSEMGKVITESSRGEWTEIGREGQIIRYEVGQLDQELKNDPTGKWVYYVRFDNEDESEAYWNAQIITFTDCVVNYNSMVHNVNLVMEEGACVASSYDATGVVSYTFDGRARQKGEEGVSEGSENGSEGGSEGQNGGTGNEAETQGEGVGEAQNGGMDTEAGEGGSEGSSGSSGAVEGNFNGGISMENHDNYGSNGTYDVYGDYDAETLLAAAQLAGVELTSYRGNEVEILSRADNNGGVSVEGTGTSATEAIEDEFGSNEAVDGEGNEAVVKGEVVEVPELGDGDSEVKNKIQWWMLPVIGALTLGVVMWWILPIAKRRKDEEENGEIN